MSYTQRYFRRAAAAMIVAMLASMLQPVITAASSWSPTLIVNTEAFQSIDDADSTSNLVLRFGDTLNRTITYDRVAGYFSFNDDIFVSANIYGSGGLLLEGGMTGATIDGFGLPGGGCSAASSKLLWNVATHRFECGTDQSGGGGNWSNTGALRGAFDDRYVNVSGDTMTGALTINMQGGTINTIGVKVINTLSGAIIQGTQQLRSSGTLITESGAYFDGSTFHIAAGPNRVGVGTALPKTAFEVVGTVSGSALTFMGASTSYILGNLGVGTTTPDTGLKLEVVGAVSGTTIQANTLLRSSGSLATESGATLDGGTLHVAAGPNRVGVGTTSPDTAFDVLGTISGSALTIQGGGTLEVLGTLSGSSVYARAGTGRFLHAVSTFAGAGLTDCDGDTQALSWDATTKQFICGDDDTGGTGGTGSAPEVGTPAFTGAVQTIGAQYVKTAGDTMTGGLIVDIDSSDIVKSTSGTTLPSDFLDDPSATVLNVVSQNDSLTIAEGAISNGGQGTLTSPSSITTNAAVGAGAMTIIRDDGKYIIVHGNTSATGTFWDGKTTTMSASPTNPSTANIGAGAIALRRPDGRYLIVNGGAATSSALFDPRGITATAAGPTLTSCTATTGTNAVQISSGAYVIMCGGSGNWGIYNPTSNTYIAGTAVGANFGAGAHAIQRDDGTFLVFAGGNTTTHWLFIPQTRQWIINPITSNAPTITTGAFSIRRADGRFLVLPGAVNTSAIYDPTPTSANLGAGSFTSQSGAGQGPTVALGEGSAAIWRQDGSYWLTIGGSTTTNIIYPAASNAGQFVTGPTLNGAPGAGSHMFLRPDGKVQLIRGGASTTTDVYDTNYVIGGPSTSTGSIYTSECMVVPALSSGSRLNFTANAEDSITVEIRTGNGSCSGTYEYIRESGDQFFPASGDNRAQVRITFQRNLPRYADQEWGMRRGTSQTRYRRVNRDPTLYDFTINNTTALHRSQFEFGNSTDPSGPVAVNIANDRSKALQIALALQNGMGTSYNTTQQAFNNGAFTSHRALNNAATLGTMVLKRPDGKFLIVAGNASANANVYNPSDETFTANTTTPTARAGSGALAFKRPDGKFVLVLGAGTKNTNIYDPVANTFTAGPLLTDAVNDGSLALPLPNGRVMILHGGYRKTTSIYDPYSNTTSTGALTAAIGRGSLALPRPDGTWLVIPGTSSPACTLQTLTMIFNPYNLSFLNNTAAPMVGGTGPGAHAFERSDGQWVIIKGGATATTCAALTSINIYNPVTNRMWASAATATAPRYGGLTLPRPDGTWLVVQGNAVTTTSLYYENAGTFVTDSTGKPGGLIVAGPTLVSATGTGTVAFQRDDGKFVLLSGANAVGSAGTTTVQVYDAGWVASGYYRSENTYIPDMDSASTLSWKSSPTAAGISAEIRTATGSLMLQKAAARDVDKPGGYINPGTNEKWLQVGFNFKRTFPSYGGIWTDVWYNGGSANNVTFRQITTPTITEYSVGKDKNLVDLKADNLSLFRVSTNGNIYTGNKGSVNTGGADLAEHYTSPDALEAGEVVAIDYASDHGVRRAAQAYQPDVLGVVSTAPGFVAGAFTKGSYPIALVGRVPVKVSAENGPIYVGDRLVSASIPGHAAKGTRAGRSIGIAMQNLDMQKLTPCPGDPKKLCGEVMMFVNLSDWPGPGK